MNSLVCWHPTHDHFVVLNSQTQASLFTFLLDRRSRFTVLLLVMWRAEWDGYDVSSYSPHPLSPTTPSSTEFTRIGRQARGCTGSTQFVFMIFLQKIDHKMAPFFKASERGGVRENIHGHTPEMWLINSWLSSQLIIHKMQRKKGHGSPIIVGLTALYFFIIFYWKLLPKWLHLESSFFSKISNIWGGHISLGHPLNQASHEIKK